MEHVLNSIFQKASLIFILSDSISGAQYCEDYLRDDCVFVRQQNQRAVDIFCICYSSRKLDFGLFSV